MQFALFGGGGAGPYDGGTLIGGDFGLTLGTDSLFFTTRLSVSGAVSARIVDDGDYVPISLCILFCDTPAPVEYRNSPHVMGALETMLGLRVRFSDSDPSSFVLGLELVQSVTPVAYRLGAALGTSVEVVF